MRYSLRTLLILLAVAPLVLAAAYWWSGPPRLSPADQRAILTGVLNDVLTNPSHSDSRDFYGTPGDTSVALIVEPGGPSTPWPKGIPPKISGFKVLRTVVASVSSPNQPRLLGITLNKIELRPQPKTDTLQRASIQVTLTNAGGTSNGGVIGGYIVSYKAKREGGKWIVEHAWSMDP